MHVQPAVKGHDAAYLIKYMAEKVCPIGPGIVPMGILCHDSVLHHGLGSSESELLPSGSRVIEGSLASRTAQRPAWGSMFRDAPS